MPNVAAYFYALGGLLGLVLGAIQSLTRSTYSKLLPDTEDHATYFSFYDVTEKIAIVLGTFVYGFFIFIDRFYAMECLVFSPIFCGILCYFKSFEKHKTCALIKDFPYAYKHKD